MKMLLTSARFWACELGARAAIVVAGLLLSRFLPVFQRQTIGSDWAWHSYPYTEKEEFPVVETALIAISTVFLCLILGLGLLRAVGKWKWSMIVDEFILAALATSWSIGQCFLFVEIIKLMYGRLRPDFLSRCFETNDVKSWMGRNNWSSWQDLPAIIEPFCLDAESKRVREGHKSFPSGHSALAFAALVPPAIWLYAKFGKFRNWGAMRLLLPSAPILLAVAVAVSRTSDYRHHSTDVLAGAFLGILVGVLTTLFYFPVTTIPVAQVCYTEYSVRHPEAVLNAADPVSLRHRRKSIESQMSSRGIDNRSP